MPDDQHVQSLIQEAQQAARKPMTFKDLKPHERAMVKAIGVVGERTYLTDEEMMNGMKQVVAYLENNLKRLNEGRNTM